MMILLLLSLLIYLFIYCLGFIVCEQLKFDHPAYPQSDQRIGCSLSRKNSLYMYILWSIQIFNIPMLPSGYMYHFVVHAIPKTCFLQNQLFSDQSAAK